MLIVAFWLCAQASAPQLAPTLTSQAYFYLVMGAPSPIPPSHQGQALSGPGKQNEIFTSLRPLGLALPLKETIILCLLSLLCSWSKYWGWQLGCEGHYGRETVTRKRDFRARQGFKGRQNEARQGKTNEYYVLWWSIKWLKSICLPGNVPF